MSNREGIKCKESVIPLRDARQKGLMRQVCSLQDQCREFLWNDHSVWHRARALWRKQQGLKFSSERPNLLDWMRPTTDVLENRLEMVDKQGPNRRACEPGQRIELRLDEQFEACIKDNCYDGKENDRGSHGLWMWKKQKSSIPGDEHNRMGEHNNNGLSNT
jgi:hypothetical protein